MVVMVDCIELVTQSNRCLHHYLKPTIRASTVSRGLHSTSRSHRDAKESKVQYSRILCNSYSALLECSLEGVTM